MPDLALVVGIVVVAGVVGVAFGMLLAKPIARLGERLGRDVGLREG